MKIVAPASTLGDIEAYNKLGVDEIYFGLREDNGKNNWDIINKRSEVNANFLDYLALEEIKTSSELSFTINSPFFTQGKIEQVKEQVLRTKDIVDNYIISDPSLIRQIKKLAPDNGLILSVIGVCLNSETARFYKRLGIRKIILPRHLNMEEYRAIVRNNPEIEFEVLIMNQYCRNIDGFCSRCHIPLGNKQLENCDILFNSKIIRLNKNVSDKELKIVHSNIQSIIQKYYKVCGLCHIREFRDIGINHLKIVGRNNSADKKIKDVMIIKKAIDNLNDMDFEKICKNLFKEGFGFRCKNNCYY